MLSIKHSEVSKNFTLLENPMLPLYKKYMSVYSCISMYGHYYSVQCTCTCKWRWYTLSVNMMSKTNYGTLLAQCMAVLALAGTPEIVANFQPGRIHAWVNGTEDMSPTFIPAIEGTLYVILIWDWDLCYCSAALVLWELKINFHFP